MQLQFNLSRAYAELFVQAYYAAALTATLLGALQAPGAIGLPSTWAPARTPK